MEVIDGDDLSVASAWPGGPVSIGNAHLAFTNDTTTYRLIISELNYGFFVLDFTWTKGRKSIEILRIEFINLKEELIKVNLPMPNAAFFTAITISK